MHWTEARILRRIDLDAGYFLLDIEEPDMARDFVAGQFVMLHRAEGDFPMLPRPFSACDLIWEDGSTHGEGDPIGLRVMIQVMGQGTQSLGRMEPEETLAIWGPLGKSFTLTGDFDHAIMVAGGVGLAPFPILTRHLRRANPGLERLTLLYGARSATDLVYLDELEALGIELRFATDDGTRGRHGNVLHLLREELASGDAGKPMIYGCGPEPMLDALAEYAVENDLSCEISMERMMARGVGACLARVVPVKADYEGGYLFEKTCIEGPVMDVKRLHLGVRCG